MPPRKANSNRLHSATTISDVPDGFVLGTGPDHKQYLVPDFMLPALEHGFAARQQKEDLGIGNVQGGVSKPPCEPPEPCKLMPVRYWPMQELQVQSKPYEAMAHGYLLFPADPVCYLSS